MLRPGLSGLECVSQFLISLPFAGRVKCMEVSIVAAFLCGIHLYVGLINLLEIVFIK